MTRAKVVRFHQIGGSEVLQIEELPIAEPGQNEVRIKVEAIGLNRAENFYHEGLYLYQPKLPSGLGYEAAGIVEAVGSNVSDITVGDRVSTIPAFSMTEYGVYGEYAIVPAYAVTHYPEELSVEEAVSIWMQYITAYGALIHYGKLKQGDYALFTAATGGLGVASIQIAKAVGAVSITTTRKQSKKSFLEDLGADHVIVTETEDMVSRVMEITNGHGIDLSFDAVLGQQLQALAEVAAFGGQIIAYGIMAKDGLTNTPYPALQAITKGLVIRGYTLFELTWSPKRFSKEQPFDPQTFSQAKQFVFDGLKSGKLKPIIDRVFPFEQIIEAHDYVESGQQAGKVVVKL